MSCYKSILICGGDQRQKYMYKYMVEKDLRVRTFALGENDINEIGDIKKFDVIILPVPVTKDGVHLNCEGSIMLSDILELFDESQIVLGGMYKGGHIIDYFVDESFQMQNAVPTAEGALQVAMENTDITINSSSCAVLGYGRIAKVLANMLKCLGADVTVCARNPRDIALAGVFGFKTESINHINNAGDFDIIFNTVPKTVADIELLGKLKDSAILIELASKPYGIDMEAAERLGKRVILASGLPGKVAPKTAGKILCDVIMDILVGMEV